MCNKTSIANRILLERDAIMTSNNIEHVFYNLHGNNELVRSGPRQLLIDKVQRERNGFIFWTFNRKSLRYKINGISPD